jgi:hypothetical protein
VPKEATSPVVQDQRQIGGSARGRETLANQVA